MTQAIMFVGIQATGKSTFLRKDSLIAMFILASIYLKLAIEKISF